MESSWETNLVRQLQRYKRYPSEALSRKEEGIVLLSFSIDRSGHVLAHRIARSSGHPDLDNEVMDMIMRAEPLPAFPANMSASAARPHRPHPLFHALTRTFAVIW